VQIAFALEHDRLAVAADVGNQLYPLRGVHQGAALVFVGKRLVVAYVGHCQRVADVARASLEQLFDFALVQRIIKIA
jgi:hypothetical protein